MSVEFARKAVVIVISDYRYWINHYQSNVNCIN